MSEEKVYCRECRKELKDFEIRYNGDLCEECALQEELSGCECSALLLD